VCHTDGIAIGPPINDRNSTWVP